MMQKILFITAFPPNDRTAGQNYSMNLLKDLSVNNKVDVLFWKYPFHSTFKSSTDNIRFLVQSVPNSIFVSIMWSFIFLLFPFFTSRFNITTLKYIRKVSHEYDILYFDFSQVFIYSLFISHPYKVMMCHDVIWQRISRQRCSYLYNWWVKRSERRLLKKGKQILCFSEKDKLLLSDFSSVSPVVVSFYIDEKIQNIHLDLVNLKSYYCFYGAWNRTENLDGLLWFISKVLPLCHSNIFFKVIGGGMPNKVQQIIERYPNMCYLGFVENPYLILAESLALIAPLFNGAGVKVKVIEALAIGTPVIGTDIAFEGIDEIIYADIKTAQKKVASPNDMAMFINHFNISLEEKIEIQKTFLSTYSKKMFVNMFK